MSSGLLLLASTTFTPIGGMLDYRWDYPAFCMYTIWISLAVTALIKKNHNLWRFSAVAAGFLLFIRFNAVVYVSLIIILFWGINYIVDNQRKEIKPIKALIGYAFGACLGGGWFLLINIKKFLEYYFNAYSSSDQFLWQLGLSGLENLLYYPKILAGIHLGIILCIILGIFMFVGITRLVLQKINIDFHEKQSLLLMVLAIIVPLTVLTISKNKNSAVISIMVGICILLSIIILGLGILKSGNLSIRINKLMYSGFIFIFLIGFGNYFLNCMTEGRNYINEDMSATVSLTDEICKYIQEYQIENPQILVDRSFDTLYANSLNVYYYEKYHTGANISNAVAEMPVLPLTFEFDDTILELGLNNADFILVSENGYSSDTNYAFDLLMNDYRKRILKHAKKNLEPIITKKCNGGLITVYAKRQDKIIIDSAWLDWLGMDNTDIFFENSGESDYLILEGNIGYAYEQMEVDATWEETALPVVWNAINGRYQIKIKINNCEIGFNNIQLFFDNYFIPSENSDSIDNRKLTVPYPDKIYME